MTDLFTVTFAELFCLRLFHQEGSVVPNAASRPQDGAWAFCSKGVFVSHVSFPLRVGLSGRLAHEHSEDSGLGFPRQTVPFWDWIWPILLAFQDHLS